MRDKVRDQQLQMAQLYASEQVRTVLTEDSFEHLITGLNFGFGCAVVDINLIVLIYLSVCFALSPKGFIYSSCLLSYYRSIKLFNKKPYMRHYVLTTTRIFKLDSFNRLTGLYIDISRQIFTILSDKYYSVCLHQIKSLI